MSRKQFADRTAVITGAGSGIGLALGNELASREARVILADVDSNAVQEAALRINDSGGRASALTIDVANSQDVAHLIDQTLSDYGRLDYLFNNAGVNVLGEALHLKLDDWERLVAVNLMGVVHGVVAAYPIMVRQGFGHIVNVASTAAVVPAPFHVPYAASKHGVVGLSLSLRAEASKYGVRVSAVCPGFIDTPMKDTLPLVGLDRERVKESVPFRYYPAERCARDILRGVARNRRIIFVTQFAKWAYRAQRLSPWLISRVAAHIAHRGL